MVEGELTLTSRHAVAHIFLRESAIQHASNISGKV